MIKRLLLLLAWGMPIYATACSHKVDNEAPITVLVMDSANSLISQAQITFRDGKKPLTTSWDGLFRFVPTQSKVTCVIQAEGYKKKSVTFTLTDTAAVQMVILNKEPNIKKQVKEGPIMTRGIMYKKMESMEMAAVATEDMVADVLEYHSEEAPMTLSINNAPSAGLLTAGEVNDFAKWALWDSVLNGSHKQFVNDWKIRTDKRYMVQVMNQDNYPIVNRQVSLLDAQGNTLFHTRTDNTGRAELWEGLTEHSQHGEAHWISVDGVRQPAVPFAQGINVFRLNEPCEQVADADVFFIVDATGSMGDEIRYLQAEMKDVIRRSQSAIEGLRIRTGALMYRDHHDEYVTRLSQLTDDIEVTQQFIDKQTANGGDDYEEAIPEALMAALNTAGWNDEARTRIAFLILDAPCHQDSATLALLHEQIGAAAAMGVRLVPVVCSGLQGSGELLLRQMALVTNGTSFFLTDDSGIGGTHLRPTTDTLVVEHLNDMMVRTIIEFCSMPDCNMEQDLADMNSEAIEPFLPAPSDEIDDPNMPALQPEQVMAIMPNPCSTTCYVLLKMDVQQAYLVDISGKCITALGARTAGTHTIDVASLSAGMYFLTIYTQGRWVTAKIIVK